MNNHEHGSPAFYQKQIIAAGFECVPRPLTDAHVGHDDEEGFRGATAGECSNDVNDLCDEL
jgi:hypothetical protein